MKTRIRDLERNYRCANDQLNKQGRKNSSKKFEYKNSCIENSEEANKPTQSGVYKKVN